MRSTSFTTTVLLSALSLAQAQTFTDCDPTKKTCPADPALGKTLTTDFTAGKSSDWTYATGTTMTYGSDGAQFVITEKHEAPTISLDKYIFFGKVSATMKSSPGTGIVSSFILESDDLDEIDWEWLGSDNGNVQTNFFGKGDTSTYDRGGTSAVATPIDTWHTYTIDWTSEKIVWSIDNNIVRTLTPNDPTAHAGTRYPQTPMKVKMGNWIGCLDASDPATQGTCQWAGGQAVFDSTTAYTMTVKSVTIEDYGCGSEYSYGDMSGSWQSIKTSGSCDGKSDDDDSSSSASASASASATTSSKISKSSGGVFAQSSTSESSKTASPTSGSSQSTASPTTMTTSTSQPQSTGSGSGDSSPTASGTGAAAPSTTPSAASKTGYGIMDFAVVGLGLIVGYLVM